MTRKEAINSGNKIYSGSPCKHCKSKKKYVSGFSCVKCSIKRNSWKLYDPLIQKYKTPEKTYSRVKKWRENNPDKWQEQWIRRSEKRHIKYENNKESRKDRDLKRTYNITLEEYKILLQKQKEKCAICDKKCKSGKNLAVDHNRSEE